MNSEDFKTAKLAEIHDAGVERGYSIATWVDVPEIGSELPKHVDYIGIGTIETPEDQIEAMELLCGEAEANDRAFSPFEFTASALNEREDRDEAWDQFDQGIFVGIGGRIEKAREAGMFEPDEEEA